MLEANTQAQQYTTHACVDTCGSYNADPSSECKDPSGAPKTVCDQSARQDSAEDFSRLNALLFTAVAWIFIPAYCFPFHDRMKMVAAQVIALVFLVVFMVYQPYRKKLHFQMQMVAMAVRTR